MKRKLSPEEAKAARAQNMRDYRQSAAGKAKAKASREKYNNNKDMKEAERKRAFRKTAASKAKAWKPKITTVQKDS